ncbi:MAG: Uma2 family endonuclease [Pleurocapsa sp. MO_226.B13]|nr:Uma2 family endonuclease [Pleurocapsa sp. MO_226.B13]
MFTARLNLPIDPNRLAQLDQTLSLSDMTWEDYEKLTQEITNYRISYFDGVITIVSPSKSHEVIERVISILINAYCRKYSLLYFPMGSTTLKNSFKVGKEPDTSYAFDTDKSIPYLAVEVIFSTGSVTELQKYKYLGVGEVWFWQNEKIKFYRLINSEYVEIDVSYYLPKLSSEFLIKFVNRGLTESPLTIESDFTNELN